jgi:hypothetical protein
MTMRIPLAIGSALAIALATATTAAADPSNGNTFMLELACSNGQHYAITLLQTAPEKAAVHVVDGPSVLVPTTFSWHTLTTVDETGAVLGETSTPPEAIHGRSAEQLETLSCTFSQFAHHVWDGVGAVTIEVDGTVEAFLPDR